ncbi:MAG: hypothetical protein IKW77_07460 [Salinivirgaceae bacterium]|nr:hypothetical protein [Salinivirgaceae bacterium]
MKLLNTNEERLMRSDYFAALVSLIAAALVMLPLLLSAKTKTGENEMPAKVKIEDSLAFRYVTCTRAAIIYTANDNTKCNLCIETLDGDVLYNEAIRTTGKSTRVFDFLNLEDGTYKVIARKNGKSLERAFTIKGGELVKGGRAVVDPIFKVNGTRAIIELPNEQRKDVIVKVLDSKGEELYSTVENKPVFKNFEFGKVDAGLYTVYVDVDGDDYKFDYNKK